MKLLRKAGTSVGAWAKSDTSGERSSSDKPLASYQETLSDESVGLWLEDLINKLRVRGYALRTEETYVRWAIDFFRWCSSMSRNREQLTDKYQSINHRYKQVKSSPVPLTEIQAYYV